MRKIFAFVMVTVDGYYEGPNQEFDFWVADDEFNAFSAEQLDEVDTLVFGRVSARMNEVAILGSSTLTASLLERGLLDELRIMVSPVALGAGKSVFRTLSHATSLRLTKSRTFDSGNVLLYYRPAHGRTAIAGV